MNIIGTNAANYSANVSMQTTNTVKSADENEETAKTQSDRVKEAFAEYMEKSPIEHWREKILEEMGLTEESLAALPPEEAAQVEEVVQQKIEQQMKQNAGLNVVV